MSESLQVDPQAALLAQQVLEAGQVIRAQQHEVRRKLVDQAEIARTREGSAEVQLAVETERLKARMAWLHEHPRLGRFIGKSAVGIAHDRNRERLATQPLTDGEISLLHGEHLIFSGLVFWKFYEKYGARTPKEIKIKSREITLTPDRSDRTLYIEQQVKDETTRAAGSRRLYELWPHNSATGPRVQVKGERFDAYASQMRRQLFANYVQSHEWAAEFAASYSDYPRLSNGERMGRFQMYEADWDEQQKVKRLNEELAPQFEPGSTWEYPDELFLEPLALVKEMNILLGTKNK